MSSELSPLVYQIVNPIELCHDESQLFVWHALEKSFGKLPIVLDKNDVERLKGLSAAFLALVITKKLDSAYDPFDQLVGEIQNHGKVRVWVDLPVRGTG